jgi:hypothetical protein
MVLQLWRRNVEITALLLKVLCINGVLHKSRNWTLSLKMNFYYNYCVFSQILIDVYIKCGTVNCELNSI